MPNDKFIELLFTLLGSSEIFFGKCVTILKRLLSYNSFAKALEQMSMAEILKGIPEKDLTFLRTIVQFLWTHRPTFVQYCKQGFTEESDENPFARKYLSLLVTLVSNYEVLLIENSEQSQILITILKDSASA